MELKGLAAIMGCIPCARHRPKENTYNRAPILHCPKPPIVAVYGYGGGCEPTILADIIIAGRSALPPSRGSLGIMPGIGGAQRLACAIGKAKAMRMTLTRQPIGAEETWIPYKNQELYMFQLNGKTALVTGAGRGMGFGIAQALARQGAIVVINDFFIERAEAAAQLLRAEGFQAHAVAADMTDRSAIFGMMERVQTEVGAIDVFVHNAGVPAQGWDYSQFMQSTPEQWDSWLQLNLYGLMHACQAVLPSMMARSWGRIITINSDAARTATGMGLCAYGAAKAGAVGFLRNLSGEVGSHGVTVNGLSLGTMNNWEGSDAIAKKSASVKRAGSPQDVGAAVVYLASIEAEWVNGQVLPVNGGSLVA